MQLQEEEKDKEVENIKKREILKIQIEALASEYQEIQKRKNKSGRGGGVWRTNGENLP